MSILKLEPPPKELRDLIDRERLTHRPDPSLARAVLGHIDQVVTRAGPAALAASRGAPGTTVGLRKLVTVGIGAFVLGGGVGAAAMRYVAPQSTALAVVSAPVVTPAEVLSAPVVTPVAEVVPTRVTATNAAPSIVAATPSGGHGDLVREREQLDAARAAMARGRYADALSAGEEHAKKWPHGYLVEEREVVVIQALIAAGRRDEAERRARSFRKSFANSMLLPVVEAALK